MTSATKLLATVQKQPKDALLQVVRQLPSRLALSPKQVRHETKQLYSGLFCRQPHWDAADCNVGLFGKDKRRTWLRRSHF